MKPPLFIFGLAVLLAPSIQAEEAGHRITLGEATERLVTQTLSDLTRDPEAAKFRKIGAYAKGSQIGICGEINRKNNFGGYDGYQPFLVVITKNDQIDFQWSQLPETDAQAYKTWNTCNQLGLLELPPRLKATDPATITCENAAIRAAKAPFSYRRDKVF